MIGGHGRTTLLASAFRQRHNLALGVASEIVAPLLKPIARALAKGNASRPEEWRRGLIIAHNHIGDVLYRTPSLQALREGLPGCEWSFLTSPTGAEVLENNPHVAEVLPWNRGDSSWDLNREQRRKLASRHFDVALCTNTLRHYPDFMLATALRIPNRVGFTYKGLSGLITHPVAIDFPSPYAGYFRTMVGDLIGKSPDWSLTPELFLDESDAREAQRVLGSMAFSGDRPLLACSLTTRQARGNWPVGFMVEVLREMRKLGVVDMVLCGGPGDGRALTDIAGTIGENVSVTAGELTVRGFAALLRKCAALFTLDSGPRHLGNAVGVRVVFARNMSHSRVEAGKYCSTETDIAPDGEHLNDAEIQKLAAATSVSECARRLTEVTISGAVRA